MLKAATTFKILLLISAVADYCLVHVVSFKISKPGRIKKTLEIFQHFVIKNMISYCPTRLVVTDCIRILHALNSCSAVAVDLSRGKDTAIKNNNTLRHNTGANDIQKQNATKNKS